MKPRRYQTIIFDVGGIIIPDAFPPLIQQEFKEEAEIPYYLSDLHNLPIWKAWNKGLATKQQVIDHSILHNDHTFVTRLINRFLNPNRPLIQESIDILHKLKEQGYHLYILSNMNKDIYENFVEKHPEIFKQFDGMCFSFQTGLVKPSPETYEYFLQKYHLNPSECLFIDDRQANLDAAQKLGIKGVLYKEGTLAQELSKHGIDVR